MQCLARLLSVDALAASFEQLSLKPSERQHAFETQDFWFKRVFGKDNGRSEKLLIPARAKVGSNSIGIKDVSSSERRLPGASLVCDTLRDRCQRTTSCAMA